MSCSNSGTPKWRQTAVNLFQIVGNPMQKRQKNCFFYQKSLHSAIGRYELPPNHIQPFVDSQCSTTATLWQSELHVLNGNTFFFITLVAKGLLIFASFAAFASLLASVTWGNVFQPFQRTPAQLVKSDRGAAVLHLGALGKWKLNLVTLEMCFPIHRWNFFRLWNFPKRHQRWGLASLSKVRRNQFWGKSLSLKPG